MRQALLVRKRKEHYATATRADCQIRSDTLKAPKLWEHDMPAGEMRAFKFRGDGDVERDLELILRNRLYCGTLDTFNDALEGEFVYSCSREHEAEARRWAQRVRDEIAKWRVCALSGTYDSHALWGHYGAAFRGFAIEVGLPEGSRWVRRVQYQGPFAAVVYDGSRDPADVALEVLSSKEVEWGYEQEIRVFARESWFPLARPVRRVIAGHRMKEEHLELLTRVCRELGILVNRTGVGDEGIDADRYWSPEDQSA